MNPLLIFKTIRDLNGLVQQANALAGAEKRWSLAYKNRSFVLACVAVVAQIALAVGVPLPVPVDVTAETIWAIISVGSILWAGLERAYGKTRAIFNRRQAVQAVQEADALTTALQGAGLDARKP